MSELNEKEIKMVYTKQTHMDYPLCPRCGNPLIPLKGSKWTAFVVCSNEKKCGKMWDKPELLGAYLSWGTKFIGQKLTEKWWQELIEAIKQNREVLTKKEET